jgi:hypothetical protein|tara:strand:- start:147 stop:359 length:213 start_codon:yes stop_codon:yes gene_type:complete
MSFSKHKRQSIQWTALVLEAVGKAKKYQRPVTLDVGRESSALLLEDALLQMALNGENAAWRVEVKLHTLQ